MFTIFARTAADLAPKRVVAKVIIRKVKTAASKPSSKVTAVKVASPAKAKAVAKPVAASKAVVAKPVAKKVILVKKTAVITKTKRAAVNKKIAAPVAKKTTTKVVAAAKKPAKKVVKVANRRVAARKPTPKEFVKQEFEAGKSLVDVCTATTEFRAAEVAVAAVAVTGVMETPVVTAEMEAPVAVATTVLEPLEAPVELQHANIATLASAAAAPEVPVASVPVTQSVEVSPATNAFATTTESAPLLF